MLSRASIVKLVCRRALTLSLSRNIALSVPCCQKAAAATDPIQKMFIDKIHEYAEKSKYVYARMCKQLILVYVAFDDWIIARVQYGWIIQC